MLKIFEQKGMFDTTLDKSPRFLIFVRWPLTLWYVQTFLSALSIPHQTISAANTNDDRTIALKIFNNPSSPCKVLLTTFSVGSAGLNLHAACNRAIVLEPAVNHSILLHAIGRLHRIGQTQKQKVWVLFQDHTIDRYLESINAKKAIPVFAAGLDESVVGREFERERGAFRDVMGGDDKDAKKRMVSRYGGGGVTLEGVTGQLANEGVMGLLGQVRSRLGMWRGLGYEEGERFKLKRVGIGAFGHNLSPDEDDDDFIDDIDMD